MCSNTILNRGGRQYHMAWSVADLRPGECSPSLMSRYFDKDVSRDKSCRVLAVKLGCRKTMTSESVIGLRCNLDQHDAASPGLWLWRITYRYSALTGATGAS